MGVMSDRVGPLEQTRQSLRRLHPRLLLLGNHSLGLADRIIRRGAADARGVCLGRSVYQDL